MIKTTLRIDGMMCGMCEAHVNDAIRSDPGAFAAECDAAFAKKVETAANKIANHRTESHIILLSGPSGSGKTTTALKIEEQLEKMGIQTHAIAMRHSSFFDIYERNLKF